MVVSDGSHGTGGAGQADETGGGRATIARPAAGHLCARRGRDSAVSEDRGALRPDPGAGPEADHFLVVSEERA